MRLTRKEKNDYYMSCEIDVLDGIPNVKEHANKLGQLEDIEEELGIDLITLFSQKYEQSYDLEVEKDEKTIYFCGDSYYGHWTKEQWLNFIKEVISAYRELAKLGD